MCSMFYLFVHMDLKAKQGLLSWQFQPLRNSHWLTSLCKPAFGWYSHGAANMVYVTCQEGRYSQCSTIFNRTVNKGGSNFVSRKSNGTKKWRVKFFHFPHQKKIRSQKPQLSFSCTCGWNLHTQKSMRTLRHVRLKRLSKNQASTPQLLLFIFLCTQLWSVAAPSSDNLVSSKAHTHTHTHAPFSRSSVLHSHLLLFLSTSLWCAAVLAANMLTTYTGFHLELYSICIVV